MSVGAADGERTWGEDGCGQRAPGEMEIWGLFPALPILQLF